MGCRRRGKQACHSEYRTSLNAFFQIHVMPECCVLQDFIYPENVAYPIGGPGSARFLVMEMHYDNPDLRSGTLGQSVFALYCVPANYRL